MRRRYVVYGLLFFLSVLSYFDRVVLSISMPVLSKTFALGPVAEGYLLSAFIWIYVILQIPGGILLDRWGTRRLAACAVALWSVATAMTGLAFNYVTLFTTRLLLGVGEAPTFPAGIRAVREWAPMRERAWATAIFQSGPAFGTATSAVIVGWILSFAGWRWAFVISGSIGLIWTVAWLAFFRDPREARWLSEPERQMILAERSAGGTDGRGLSVAELMSYQTMWGLFITQGCVNYTQYLALTWLPSYLVTSRGLNLMHSGVDIAIIYIGACLLTLLFGRLSDTVLPHEAAMGGARRYGVMLFCALASVMLAVPFVQSTTLLVVVLTLSLTGVQSALTNNYALVSDMLRDGGGIGRAVSWLQLGGNVFGLFAPIGTGYLVSATGSFTSAFLLAGGLLIFGALVSLTMTRRPLGEDWHRDGVLATG